VKRFVTSFRHIVPSK